MKTNSLSPRFRIKNLPFFTFLMSTLLLFLFAGSTALYAQDDCDIEKGWWDAKYLTLNSGIEDNDTIHLVSCQDPWGIKASDLKYYDFLKNRYCGNNVITRNRGYFRGFCVKIKTYCYLVDLPEDAPEGMYQLWKYEYVIDDVYCHRKYKKTYYLALYDHGAPIFQCFPNDTTVASEAEIPPADSKVMIIDVCQYVAWDSIMMIPILNEDSSATIGYTRRWMARDPSGNESYKDQKIWFASSANASSTGLNQVTSRSNRQVAEWKVYPNPAKNMVHIDMKSDVQLRYTVFDALGRSLKRGDFYQGQPIQLEELGAGVYHIQLQDQEKVLGTKKVLLIE